MSDDRIQIDKNGCKFILRFSDHGHISIHCDAHSGFVGPMETYRALDSICIENLNPFLKKLAELIQS